MKTRFIAKSIAVALLLPVSMTFAAEETAAAEDGVEDMFDPTAVYSQVGVGASKRLN